MQSSTARKKYCDDACQRLHEWSREQDGRRRTRPPSAARAMEMIDDSGDQDAGLASAFTETVNLPLAQAGLEVGECVIHKPGYEPHPARRGKTLDGSHDFEPEMFRSEDGSLPRWLEEFLAEFPRSGAAVGFTARVTSGSWAKWEQRPETGRTLGSY